MAALAEKHSVKKTIRNWMALLYLTFPQIS